MQTNLTKAVAAGVALSPAVREDGAVVQWGANWAAIPANLTNALTVAAGARHTLALRTDSSFSAWGTNDLGQTTVPGGLTNVVAVAAGGNQSLALRSNGTVTNWGPPYGTIPADLTNAIAIACGTNFNLALRSGGAVVAWGDNADGRTNVPASATNVVAIAAGGGHSLALKSNGTVVAWGLNTSGQATVPTGLSNVMAVAAGLAHSVALKNDGTVVAWGSNGSGQTNGFTNLPPVESIAAGGNHTLAAIFSPLVQYAVDVTKDLLLIYNTNSTNSIVVKDYYLAHRPMVGGANVLGINCTTNEQTSDNDFTNQILPQVSSWLAANPTKRPQYMILFPDLPSRVWTGNSTKFINPVSSVAYGISTAFPGIQPFVTSINMGLSNPTNDCVAYINKLHEFATNSPNQLIITASAGVYANTNYVIDNVGYEGFAPGTAVSSASNGLVLAGVPLASITYLEATEPCIQTTNNRCIEYQALPHITNAVQVAGYISWGIHSGLGGLYSVNGMLNWGTNSAWWIIETIESFNGWRGGDHGHFTQWFSANAFGSTNYDYANTPVGAVSNSDEPQLPGTNKADVYFGLWAGGKPFAICAWASRRSIFFQAVGDPFVKR